MIMIVAMATLLLLLLPLVKTTRIARKRQMLRRDLRVEKMSHRLPTSPLMRAQKP
jgi:hypothetical protein